MNSSKPIIIRDIQGVGTKWSFAFYENIDIIKTRQLLTQNISEFENLYSRFKQDSILSKLNKHKKLQNPTSELVQMIQKGLEYYDISNELFNIATAEHQISQGYDSNYSFKPNNQIKPITKSPKQAIIFKDHSIELDQEISIDLGGVGKGFLIDKLSDIIIKELGYKFFVINGGGDIYVTSNHDNPIFIHLKHPINNEIVDTVSAKNQSICGSSPTLRSWGKSSHIINPQNLDKKVIFGSFVIADKTQDADIIATIATLCPPQEINNLEKITGTKILQIPLYNSN
jgi:FAD:protein FMN transferase